MDESSKTLTFEIIGFAIAGTEPKRAEAKIAEIYPMIAALFCCLRKSLPTESTSQPLLGRLHDA